MGLSRGNGASPAQEPGHRPLNQPEQCDDRCARPGLQGGAARRCALPVATQAHQTAAAVPCSAPTVRQENWAADR